MNVRLIKRSIADLKCLLHYTKLKVDLVDRFDCNEFNSVAGKLLTIN